MDQPSDHPKPGRPRRFFGPDDDGEQDEHGIDLFLIREELKLTPLERVRRGDAARRQTQRLREYGRRYRQESIRTDRRTACFP